VLLWITLALTKYKIGLLQKKIEYGGGVGYNIFWKFTPGQQISPSRQASVDPLDIQTHP